MISFEAGFSTGYTGIAWADIAIRPRPMANADAASTFMGFSFPLFIRRDAAEFDLRKQCGGLVMATAFSSEVDTGSREENASKSTAPYQ
jgi:hypothetical protein